MASSPARTGAGPDEKARLAAFRARHPGTAIAPVGSGCWQAVTPEADGETVVTRYSLGDLLDKLGELAGEAGQ